MDANNAQLAFSQGTAAFYGRGMPQNVPYAWQQFSAAAGAGHPGAMLFLGFMNERGIAVPPNAQQADYYYSAAAGAGNATAQLVWGLRLLRSGNATAAFHTVSQAAQGGNVYAMYLLSAMFRQGHGAPQMASAADMWLQRAADAGFAPAQHRLRPMGV